MALVSRGRLISASCTTGWFYWIHGELWLLQDGLLRLRLNYGLTVARGLARTVPDVLDQYDFDRDEIGTLVVLHRTNVWVAATDIVGGRGGAIRVHPKCRFGVPATNERFADGPVSSSRRRELWERRGPEATDEDDPSRRSGVRMRFERDEQFAVTPEVGGKGARDLDTVQHRLQEETEEPCPMWAMGQPHAVGAVGPARRHARRVNHDPVTAARLQHLRHAGRRGLFARRYQVDLRDEGRRSGAGRRRRGWCENCRACDDGREEGAVDVHGLEAYSCPGAPRPRRGRRRRRPSQNETFGDETVAARERTGAPAFDSADDLLRGCTQDRPHRANEGRARNLVDVRDRPTCRNKGLNRAIAPR